VINQDVAGVTTEDDRRRVGQVGVDCSVCDREEGPKRKWRKKEGSVYEERVGIAW